jgi:D-aminopeptidase
MRARDLGIAIGSGAIGPHNAITDVDGVKVGQVTLIRGEGPLRVGEGPVRTGVTVILPRDGSVASDPCFAGCHRLNGFGELTGLECIRENGLLTSPVAITNSHSVGIVHDALITWWSRRQRQPGAGWSLPVVGETWDGVLNDIDGQHVRPEHVFEALESAQSGPVAEGNVGGGTGMICHGFKGGTGTASRVLDARAGGYTVGVLVQANHGQRLRLRIDGVPVGEQIPPSEIPVPELPWPLLPGSGSIIVVVATDAPLLPHQCNRLAQRAGLGIARVGGLGENWSGDIFLAFSTANHGLGDSVGDALPPITSQVTILSGRYIDALFEAVVDATEEAILNALLAAETMVGRDGATAHRLDPQRLAEILRPHGRLRN